MKKLIYIFSSLALLGLWSCEDFFSTTVNVDPPETTPKLAVAFMANAQDLILTAFVDGSTDIFGTNDPNSGFGGEGISGATLELFAGTTSLGKFQEVADPFTGELKGYYGLELSENLGSFGNEFELVASHPDYPTAKATQKLPTKVEPTKYEYFANAGVDEYGYPTEGVEVTFQDPAGEKNFYEISVFFKDSFALVGQETEYYFNSTYSSTFDPNGSQGPNYSDLFVNDNGFDGEQKKFLVQFESYGDTSNKLVVVFNSISEARYRFATSLRAFQDSGDFGPFGEPVSIYSNFENGLGTFGLGNAVIDEL